MQIPPHIGNCDRSLPKDKFAVELHHLLHHRQHDLNGPVQISSPINYLQEVQRIFLTIQTLP